MSASHSSSKDGLALDNATLAGSHAGAAPGLNLLLNLSPALASSRRQKLLGLARATRDTYIPRFTSSVTLLALNVTARSNRVGYDDFGYPLSFPSDTTFTLFPSYTRIVTAAESPLGLPGYVALVRGWMWCPGIMSRKNRLVLSLAKQVASYNSGESAQNAVERLGHDPALLLMLTPDSETTSDTESVVSAGSTASSVDGNSSTEVLIKERLSSFIARSVSKAQLSVLVGAVDSSLANSLVTNTIYTDINGHFECEIFTPYEPSVVQVSSTIDETICACQEVTIMKNSGLGVISDIDDTVKLTGVIGDKRVLMNRMLVGNINTWIIPSVVKWFQDLKAKSDTTFHYVSNSPWQLFTLINQYFNVVNLPPGSVHLKQYSGNIIASLMEPSSSRKSNTLKKILRDFPKKKFICVGDSGEQDLEAYVDLAHLHPDRVCAIYIRAVPHSFSLVDDASILSEINCMIEDWNKRQAFKLSSKIQDGAVPDLIDLSEGTLSQTATERKLKLPPIVPRKPEALKGKHMRRMPPLPERKYLKDENFLSKLDKEMAAADDGLSHSPPPPPPPRRSRTTTLTQPDTTPYSEFEASKAALDKVAKSRGAEDFYELEDIDAKGALFIQRVAHVLHRLDGTNTKLEFFQDADAPFFERALEMAGSSTGARSV